MAGPDTIGSPRKWIDSAVELGRAVRGEVALAFSVECPESDSCVGAFASLEARSRDESSQPNVVLISIDTLRADRMSLYGNPRLTTARIDRWAEDRGVTFEQAVVQAPWTLPSHISMLTGLNPTTHGVNHRTAAPVELELLAERLRSKGYFTAAVTGGGFMSPHFGIWQGFDVFRYWGEDSETLPTVEVTGGVSRALELVDEIGERPFFLLFHTFEVHNPYHPQPPYFRAFYDGFAHSRSTISTREVDRRPVGDHRVFRELIWRRSDGQVSRLPDERRPLALAMYDSGLAYTDEQIGRLLDELDARGLSENTIVVLTSDHGELLGEEGLGGHVYLHDANLLVPLVFSWPEELVGSRRIDVQVRSIDIVPTLLELLGVDETGDLDGVSLVPLLRDEVEPAVPEAITYAASSNRGVSVRIDNRFKYTYDDTLWRSGFVESFRSIGTNSLAALVDRGTRVTRLRHQVERLLDGRDGLKMHLANKEGPGDLVVRLQGPMVQVKNLKATGLQCECAHWLDRSSAEVALPRDHGFTIHFDDVSAGILSVELRSDDAVYNAELDVSNLGAGVAITLSDGVWAESERLDKLVQRGIALWWQGAAPLAENVLLDEEVLQRLRALGYIR